VLRTAVSEGSRWSVAERMIMMKMMMMMIC
jgi:hypothetical protein